MKRNYLLILATLVLFLGVFILSNTSAVKAKAKPTYTVSPGSNTYKGDLMNYSTYNSNTKHYYLLRSYLERMEETDGGTLVLKKGTYTVTNTLYVPSNVTIKLQNGAKIVKGTKSGTTQFKAAKSIFQLVRPSRSKQTGVYGGYKGEKNISFIGYGSATIDMKYVKNGIAIIAGHNQNISIKNIRFQNMKSGHFIEIDATKNATISNNKFMNSKPSTNRNKEAINIDTPDKATNGWSQKWSNFDRTPNSKLTIKKNTFYNLDRAIGTHKYSGGKYHDHVVIKNNKIEKMRQDAIRVMNWSNATIANNTFKDVNPGPKNDRRGILVSGAHNPTFKNNVFENIPRAMQFTTWKNSGPGSKYKVTHNKLNAANKKALATNTVINYMEDFIRINHKYLKYDKKNTDYVNVKTAIFSDLLEDDSGYVETMDLVDRNIISGYGDHTFRPYESISRAHVAVILANALELTPKVSVSKTLSVYKDVNKDHLYAKQIAAVTEAGIFKGVSGKFNPDQKITRSQLATVLVGALDLEGNDTTVKLTDLDKINKSHRNNVEIFAQNKITIGKPDNKGNRYFDGNGDLKRVQFAVFLNKAMKVK